MGRSCIVGSVARSTGTVSSEQLLKVYRDETNRQKAIVQKAKLCETRLVFTVSALKQLFERQQLHYAAAGRGPRLPAPVPCRPNPRRSLLTMVNRIRFACDPKILLLPVSSILPVRKITPGHNQDREISPHRSIRAGGRDRRTPDRLPPRSMAARSTFFWTGTSGWRS